MLAVALLLSGCQGPTLPKTYPVTGRVTIKNGQPVTEGSVRFVRVDDPGVSANGILDDQGAFKLSSVHGSTRQEGAEEGKYRISVQLPQGPKQTSPRIRQNISEAKIVPGDNHIAIEIEPIKSPLQN